MFYIQTKGFGHRQTSIKIYFASPEIWTLSSRRTLHVTEYVKALSVFLYRAPVQTYFLFYFL